MTEQEWLGCIHPREMLEFLRGKASERKLRLFAVACCRQISHLIGTEDLARAVEVAEQFAEGQVTDERRKAVYDEVFWRTSQDWYDIPAVVVGSLASSRDFSPSRIAKAATDAVATTGDLRWGYQGDNPAAYRAATVTQLFWIRCIFGTPFIFRGEMGFSFLGWKDRTISKIAQAIYDEKAFDRLPILGDVLEEAGCTDQAILAHCRQPGEHVRGCWALDQILGKE
jgi:hypothetical protein